MVAFPEMGTKSAKNLIASCLGPLNLEPGLFCAFMALGEALTSTKLSVIQDIQYAQEWSHLLAT